MFRENVRHYIIAISVILLGLLLSTVAAAQQTVTSEQALLDELNHTYFSANYHSPSPPVAQQISQLETLWAQAEQQQWSRALPRLALALARRHIEYEEFAKAKRYMESYPQQYQVDTVADLIAIELSFARMEHDIDTVEQLFATAEQYRPLISPYQQAEIDLFFGLAFTYLNLPLRALPHLESANIEFEQVGDQASVASVQNVIAVIHSRLGNYQQAAAIYSELLRSARAENKLMRVAILQFNFGSMYIIQQDYDRAISALNESLQLSQQLNDPIGIAYAQINLAEVAVAQERYQQAKDYSELALVTLTIDEMQTSHLHALYTLTSAQVGLGELVDAELTLQRLVKLSKDYPSEEVTLNIAKITGQLRFAQQDYASAFSHYLQFANQQQRKFEHDLESSSHNALLELQRRQEHAKQQRLKIENEQQLSTLSTSTHQHMTLLAATGVLLTASITAGLFGWREIKTTRVLAQAAMCDHLTKAPNRRAVMQKLNQAIRQARARNQPLTAAIIDLDNFKLVNDRFGHETGDKVLQAFAQLCERQLRAEDCYGRFGGEEWLVVLPNTTLENAHLAFNRLQEPWINSGLLPDDGAMPLTFSMGAVQWHPSHKSVDSLLKQADDALYLAKRAGRNQLMLSTAKEAV